MAELTREDLYQIKEALKTGIELAPTYRTDNPARDELQAALDIVTKLLEVPAAKVEAAPVVPKAKAFGTVFKIGGGYLAKWFDGEEFQSRRDFATRKEANNFLRSLNAEILSAADYEFPARAARRQVSEQRKAQK